MVFEFLNVGDRRACADAGDAGLADVHRALALERFARAGSLAVCVGPQSAAADPAHAIRRPAGRGFPGSGRVRRKPGRYEIRIPDHPLVNETIRNCLHEAMDLDGLKTVIDAIGAGEIRTVAIDTAEPSPLSHEILNANPYAYLDDAPLEERRARAVQMRRTLGSDAGEIGALDPAAIEEVSSESWPVVRDADELHDALLTLMVLPPVAGMGSILRRACQDAARCRHPPWRARILGRGGTRRCCLDSDDGPFATVRGWMESTGPLTVTHLANAWLFRAKPSNRRWRKLESGGQVLRGRFTPGSRAPDSEIEWCNRRLLARIHRLTLGRLRQRNRAGHRRRDFMRFLFAGSTSRRARNFTAWMARFRS